MIVYHGTVDAYLPSIEKEGLKVVPKTRFLAVKPNPFWGDSSLPLKPGIYVTSRRQSAENFAILRAIWLSIPLGGGLNVFSGPGNLYKEHGEVIANAKPIILELDLDAHLAATLRPDDRSDEGVEAFWTPVTIPASCIKAVLNPKTTVEEVMAHASR